MATRQVQVGTVPVGGGAPVAVQSMLDIPTTQVQACLEKIGKLEERGCEIIRLAIPHADALDAFQEICRESPLPVVADIHFDHQLAIEAAKRGAAKLRINPGNIGSWEKVDAVIDAAGEAGIPIRIGVNAGSLEQRFREKEGLSLPQRLMSSVQDYVEHFWKRGFEDIVVSAKAHDVPATVATYRLLHERLPQVPLHLGITEAGTLRQGTVKSATGLGILLSEGIGDTLRVSLTADLEEEVLVAWEILAALGIRRRTPEIICCPTCGRTEVDLRSIAEEVNSRLQTIHSPLKVAVMGCVVNGPGEASDADIGVACGKGVGVIFKHGKTVAKVDESCIVEALFQEIGEMM